MTDGSVVSVQPDNVDSFLSALEKRIERKITGMRLKYLSALVVGVVLSLPTQAQVYLDSTEVANVLHPKAVVVTQPRLPL